MGLRVRQTPLELDIPFHLGLSQYRLPMSLLNRRAGKKVYTVTKTSTQVQNSPEGIFWGKLC